MQTNVTYDCAIVGGGVAGLCLAIQLVRLNHSVILFEKNTYPFHKVCGEYISKESWDFLVRIGLPLGQMHLPEIHSLGVSSASGFMVNANLASGGFGISRYSLDANLCAIARKLGVTVLESCKVHDVSNADTQHILTTSTGQFVAKIVCGSYGKHQPVFIKKADAPVKQNYIGVKYHIKANLDSHKIELHNFAGGYCGISKIEDDKYCLCYLTTAQSLKANNNSIEQLEANTLMKNPFLKKYFLESEFLFKDPLVISNVSFNKKHTSSNGVFMLGDAAGAIAPLCGNGMSMGMRASMILAAILDNHLTGRITLADATDIYRAQWTNTFSQRIQAGYYLQQLLGKNVLTDVSLKFLQHTPKLFEKIISLTHGQPF